MSFYRLKGTAGPVINQAWTLEDRTVIGSADECTIRLDSESVAPRHAMLEVGGETIHLQAMEPGAELFLNGQSIENALLNSGDEIRIGSCRWLLQAPGLKPQKVLTEDAVRRRPSLVPWLIGGGVSALGLLAWWLGYLPF